MTDPMELAALNRKRGNIRGQLTKLASAIGDELNAAKISARIQTLEKLQTKFDQLKEEYYRLVSDAELAAIEPQLTEIDDELQDLEVGFKTMYLEIQDKNESVRSNIVNNTIMDNSSTIPSAVRSVSMKIPEIPLPIFTGRFEDYRLFKAQFESLIDQNSDLTACQKLYYLQASLKGDARQIQTTDDTYESLLKALEDRYNNERVIIDSHVKSIINHEKLMQESAKDLRKLLDCVTKNLRALKVLDFRRDKLSNTLLLNILIQKLDRETRRNYELTLNNKEVPNFDEFMEFLERRCQILESIGRNIAVKNKGSFQNESSRAKSLFAKSGGTNSPICVLDKKPHSLYKCESFLKLSPEKRYEVVRLHVLCLNCLGRHKVASCQSKYKCNSCGARHHTLLCKNENSKRKFLQRDGSDTACKQSAEGRGQNELIDSSPPSENQEELHSYFSRQQKRVLLATAVVFVKDINGVRRKCRCVLDSGSMVNILTQRMADSLGLRKQKSCTSITGLSDCSFKAKSKTTTTVSNADGSFSENLSFLVVDKITDMLPSACFDVSALNLPDHVTLADPGFFSPARVDLLIGGETFFQILKDRKFHATPSLILQETVFGFVVCGTYEGLQQMQHCGFVVNEESNLEATMKRFWELESVLETPISKTREELICEELFMQTYRRDGSGKYIVTLPMKENINLGDSVQLAEKSLKGLWNRLDKSPELAGLYCDFMKEYQELGHMKELKEESSKLYVMPHHGVYKPDSSTTKLRVVFNASAPSTSGLSLNDCLLNGGIVQEDLFAILLRFRRHQVAFTADVRKMYRQIWVDSDQCNFQCILWKKNSLEKPTLYQLLTVTYGLKCAPYLATRVLKQLAVDESARFPLASSAATRDFYVDDILTGTEDVPSAIELQEQLIKMLKAGGMELHKWCSNSKELLEQVPYSDQEYHFDDDGKDTVKTLGLRWNPNEDHFCFTVSTSNSIPTKRSVLADLARLFDPLGLLGPVIVQAKIFLQKLWLLKLNWDDELPSKERQKWEKFRSVLAELQKIKINRCVLLERVKEVELLGFCDSSKDAYGACVYLRCVSVSDDVKVSLLCSKSKVAPIKVLTIPRLELCAAELLSKLVNKVLSSLNLEISRVHLYTDSTIVLAWINSAPHAFKVFVSNRISRIQELTKDFHWQHVKTDDNPADLISRGLSPDRIQDNQLWWRGPDFVHGTTIMEYEHPSVTEDTHLLELKKIPDISLALAADTSLLDTFLMLTNNLTKLLRILSFFFRFIRNSRCSDTEEREKGPLTVEELTAAEVWLVQQVQRTEFNNEFKRLSKGDPVQPGSKLASLNCFLDKDQTIRVGGRLKHSDLSIDKKHPMVLPPKHILTEMVLKHYHLKFLHIGAQALLFHVRQKYWPLNGRKACRKTVHECLKCFKFKPSIAAQIMGDLPKERVTATYAFNCTGVDFCGPFFIKYKNQRKGIRNKIYVCVFLCMATRAIHLDFVTDFTSKAFIACLKRFFGRRGRSAKIMSDNAKNFVGANKELKVLHQLVKFPDEMLAKYFIEESVDWHFIPPKSPNFGGLWEAGVKSFKFHLKRVVGNSHLTLEEFLTVLAEIEGVLNSRPLTPLSAEFDDFQTLTPSHFLIGRPVTSIVEPQIIDINENRLSKWQRVTQLSQRIWKLWKRDYLNNLQERGKWKFSKNNVDVGTLVLVKNDDVSSTKWLTGRIAEVFPGKDGKIRVANVRFPGGKILKRNVRDLCILPIEQ